jgi:mevalonate kinase
MGLSIPHTYYKGAFQFNNAPNAEQAKSNEHLIAYLTYLKSPEAPCRFDFSAFEKDLSNGLYFDSSIPQGFGVGSSGALVAAIYDRYCLDKIPASPEQPSDIKALKQLFSWMESYFHGKKQRYRPNHLLLRIALVDRE